MAHMISPLQDIWKKNFKKSLILGQMARIWNQHKLI